MTASTDHTPQPTLFGHPRALYVLFFAEMWERFSYYGMRALLMLYMTQYLMYNPGEAGGVYGDYTGLVYLTPLLGGFLADRYLGMRRAIILGGLTMALGHALMAVDDRGMPDNWFLYGALACLVVGNGLFKPNISTLVGALYPPGDTRRDGGFTIFYMGINIGAFLAPLGCGWVGQKTWGEVKDLGLFQALEPAIRVVLGGKPLTDGTALWHLGFGVAAIGMLLGLVVFWWGAKRYLGDLGVAPARGSGAGQEVVAPLLPAQRRTLAIVGVTGLLFVVFMVWAKVTATREPPKAPTNVDELAATVAVSGRADLRDLIGKAELALTGTVVRVRDTETAEGPARALTLRPTEVLVGDVSNQELIVLVALRPVVKGKSVDLTPAVDRLVPGGEALLYLSAPLASGLRLPVALSGEALLTRTTLSGQSRLVGGTSDATRRVEGELTDCDVPEGLTCYDPASWSTRTALALAHLTKSPSTLLVGIRAAIWPVAGVTVLLIFTLLMLQTRGGETSKVGVIFAIGVFVMVFWAAFEQAGSSLTLFAEERSRLDLWGVAFESSMFQAVNPWCIILLGPVFTAIWSWLAARGREPSTPMKMAFGLGFNGLGYALMIGAAYAGAGGVKVSALWLIAFYTLQTMGELCLSPVGLSLVTKLAPHRFAAMLMGVWFLANAFANKLAGLGAEKIESMGPLDFFVFITLVLGGATAVLVLLVPRLRRWMGGVH